MVAYLDWQARHEHVRLYTSPQRCLRSTKKVRGSRQLLCVACVGTMHRNRFDVCWYGLKRNSKDHSELMDCVFVKAEMMALPPDAAAVSQPSTSPRRSFPSHSFRFFLSTPHRQLSIIVPPFRVYAVATRRAAALLLF